MQAAARGSRSEALEDTLRSMRRVGAAIKGRFHRALGEHDLTLPQWIVLKALHPRGSLTARELADHLDATPANVTGILDRLEDARLVARAKSPDDGRVVLVRLTERGRGKVDAMQGVGAAILADMFDGWTVRDLGELRAMLERIRIAPDDAQEF